jgi:enoyl-CoA hydratase/carnithine racemase
MATVLYEKRGKIAYVTINRPEVRNCIDPVTHDLMWETWRDFAADDAVELAILTGAGDAFCAGADLKAYIPPLLPGSALTPRSRLDNGFCGITRGQHRIYKPIVAAVNGWALAGGLELALACDIRVASERAQFGSFEVRRGYHHGDGGIARLVNVCGAGVALEMLLTGEPVDAERALRLNLVSRVVPHDKLMEETEKVAATILRNDPWAIRSAKETILDVIGRPLDDQLRIDCLNGYSGAGNPTVKSRLEEFYRKTDAGRAGTHATDLGTGTPSKT